MSDRTTDRPPARARQHSHPDADLTDVDRLKRRIEDLERERSATIQRTAEEVVGAMVAQLVVALRAEVENAVGAHVAPLVKAVEVQTSALEAHIRDQQVYRATRENAERERHDRLALEREHLQNEAARVDILAKREALPTSIDGTAKRRIAIIVAVASVLGVLSNLATALIANHH